MCFIILPQLAPVRKRELFFIFAVAAHEDAYRRARKIETAAQRIFEIALVAEMHKVGVVDLDDESRRRDRNFRDVKQFQLLPSLEGGSLMRIASCNTSLSSPVAILRRLFARTLRQRGSIPSARFPVIAEM